MMQGCENPQTKALRRRAPHVSYQPAEALTNASHAPHTLALFTFDNSPTTTGHPLEVRVPLECLGVAPPVEIWEVDAPVSRGMDDTLRWSAGAGWLFAVIELDEREYGGPIATARMAYERLHRFVSSRAEHHVLRVWNYLDAINQGDGDSERYKLFCSGRVSGMGDFFAEGFPAATAIGHNGPVHLLQVYLLACDQPGTRVENPRQVSAWHYPREYGRTPPSFARAMTLPAQDVLAISGTAAVVGHRSAHQNDLDAQLEETLTNLDALLTSAGMPASFDAQSPLKVYVRHRAEAAHVRDFLQRRLPNVPLLLLHGDVCRRELLVEIDGWRYA
ncbi:MAG: pteridine-dependent deoxygenase [Rhodanobacter sp.]